MISVFISLRNLIKLDTPQTLGTREIECEADTILQMEWNWLMAKIWMVQVRHITILQLKQDFCLYMLNLC